MSVVGAVERVVGRLGDGQVEALAAACASGGGLGAAVLGGAPAAHEAVADLRRAWSATPELTGAGVALALRVALRARQDAAARRAQPVWTGPSTAGNEHLTASVLHELIGGARSTVLLMSFAAHTLPSVATDLEQAVARGCEVDVVFETTEDSAGAYDGPHAAAFEQVRGVGRWRWPSDQRQPGAVLHAKLLVVDRERALVGSANLTDRALAMNLEAGVLVNDAGVAGQLDGHVRSLMRRGCLLREQ